MLLDSAAIYNSNVFARDTNTNPIPFVQSPPAFSILKLASISLQLSIENWKLI